MSKKTLTEGIINDLLAVDDQADDDVVVETKPKKKAEPKAPAKQHPNAGKLTAEYQRFTMIARKDLIEKLKDIAYTERKNIKDVCEEMLEAYTSGKKTIKRR